MRLNLKDIAMPEITVEAFNVIVEEELPWAFELGVQATEIGAGVATLMMPRCCAPAVPCPGRP
jgi:hypothetical protein